MGCTQDTGSEIRKQTYPRSRIQGSKSTRSRVNSFFFVIVNFFRDCKTKSKIFNWMAENAIWKKGDLKTCRKVESGTGNSNRAVSKLQTMKIDRGADRPEKAFHDPLSVPRLVLSPTELPDYGVAGLKHRLSLNQNAFVFLLLSSSTCIFIFQITSLNVSITTSQNPSCFFNAG